MSVKLHPFISTTPDGPRLVMVPGAVTAAAGERVVIDGVPYEIGARSLVGPRQRSGTVQRPRSKASSTPRMVQRPKPRTSTKPRLVTPPTIVKARCPRCVVGAAMGKQTEVGTIELRRDAMHSTGCTVCGRHTPRDRMPAR